MIKEYTIDNKDRKDYLKELTFDCSKDMAVLDNFEDCLLYYSDDEDGNRRAVYLYEDLVEHFTKTNKCSYVEAVEFVDYNVMRTIPYMYKVGDIETTIPIIIHRIDPTYTTLDDSYFKE